MVKCITSAKYSMTATVLTRLGQPDVVAVPNATGVYVREQDEDSGEIHMVFVPDVTPPTANNTEGLVFKAQYDISCRARGYTDLGFRSSANHDLFLKGDYSIFEAVEMYFPAKYDQITRSSYIANIRNDRQVPLWTEAETDLPTVFRVQGVTPVFDPFGRLKEWVAVVTRAEIQ